MRCLSHVRGDENVGKKIENYGGNLETINAINYGDIDWLGQYSLLLFNLPSFFYLVMIPGIFNVNHVTN